MSNNFYRSGQGSAELQQVLVNGRQLFIYLNDEKKSLLIWDLDKCTAQWKEQALSVTKGNEELNISGDEAGTIISAWAASRDKQAVKRRRFDPINTYILTIFLIFVGSCLLIYFVILPWAVRHAVSWVPVEYEVKIGETMSRMYEPLSRNDSADYYMKQFAAHLELSEKFPIDVKVIPSAEINAFALPGGKIFVYSGLLKKMDDYGQLAALLGHEVSHVTERHALRQMFNNMASGLIISLFFGDFSAAVLSQAEQFRELDYSRDLETEADLKGLDLMVKNQVSPGGMLKLLHILEKESAEMPSLMKYLSTHPDTQE